MGPSAAAATSTSSSSSTSTAKVKVLLALFLAFAFGSTKGVVSQNEVPTSTYTNTTPMSDEKPIQVHRRTTRETSNSESVKEVLGVNLPPDYEVVYPYITDARGRYLDGVSFTEDEYDNKRRRKRKRRHLTSGHDSKVFVGFQHHNDTIVLKLRANRRLLSPTADVKWFTNHRLLQSTSNLTNHCYYVGRLKHQRHSVAALDICNGLTGFIQSGDQAYFITPLRENGTNAAAHLFYPVNNSQRISLADDQWRDDEGLDENHSSRKNRRSISSKTNQLVAHKTKEKFMAVTVAADHSVVQFHGNKIEQFILVLMNIVNAIYADPSLGAKLFIVVTRIILLKDPEESKITEGNPKESLENICHWFKELNGSPAGHRKHDVGIYLTRLDIGGPSGYAPVGGMCNPRRSCSLNRDEGLTSAFVIAHEIGHVLGFSHDGDEEEENTCSHDGGDGSVMAPLVLATFTHFRWSKCTVNEYRNKINKWFCLNDRPVSLATRTSLLTPLGRQYTLDEQCRMEFGDHFFLCRSFMFSDPCIHLWCSNRSTPLMCKTKKGPPLEGTPCGKGKWCDQGFCQFINRKKMIWDPVLYNPRHGNWGDWSNFGDCSKSCGVGVRFRTRKCDSPRPAYGGKQCPGLNEEFELCNKQACPTPKDFRAEQCAKVPVSGSQRKRHKDFWIPYAATNDSSHCKLACQAKKTGEIFISEDNVIDGTLCSYDLAHHLCIQGQCQAVGCDKVPGSNKTDDSCGVCGGDNSSCKDIQKLFVRLPTKNISRLIVLPRGARQIEIKEISHTSNRLVLQRRLTKELVLNVKENGTINKLIVCEGTKFNYMRNDSSEIITGVGPLLDEVIVMLGAVSKEETVMVTVRYTINKQKNQFQERQFVWDIRNWLPCSKTCGGGEQLLKPLCRDRQTERAVSKRFCSILEKPAAKTRVCNSFSCTYRWQVGSWEHCTHTCGSRGFQQRPITCIPMNDTTTSADPLLCQDTKPEQMIPCNRFPCPSQWETGLWSKCSVTCGVGVQTRIVQCLPPGNEIHYDCVNNDKPEEQRKCHMEPCTDITCSEDSSKYCQIKVLHRYCQIPSYRKRCCHTCTNYVSIS